MLRSVSSRRPLPLTARIRSLSHTKAVSANWRLSTSASWAARVFTSPMGEYFLKITSPSPVVKISSGSPRRMRWVRRISLGITTLPSSSMRRTIPVAFIILPSLRFPLYVVSVNGGKLYRQRIFCFARRIAFRAGFCYNK